MILSGRGRFVSSRAAAITVGAALLLPGASFAQTTKTYVGPFTGNWNNAANWDPAGVPANNDAVILGTEQSFKTGDAVVDFDFAYSGSGLNAIRLNASGSNSSITLRQSLASSAMVVPNGSITIGYDVAKNTYDQSAGSVSAGMLTLGTFTNGGGAYKLSGGSLTLAYDESVGYYGAGSFTQSGGTHTVAGSLTVAAQNGSAGTFVLSGTGVLRAQDEEVGQQGTGVFTQSGGTNTVTSAFGLGSEDGNGTFNLDGGILEVPFIFTNIGSTFGGGGSHFTFNGGTVRPRGSNPDFYPGNLPGDHGLTEAIVKTGGAIFDTNGFDIGVAQPLIHDTLLGSTADGGLVKRGIGTLTLKGANTYTGPTHVVNGILAAGIATNAFGSKSAVTLDNTVGVTLDITGFNNAIGSLTGGGGNGGGVTLGAATLTIGGDKPARLPTLA